MENAEKPLPLPEQERIILEKAVSSFANIRQIQQNLENWTHNGGSGSSGSSGPRVLPSSFAIPPEYLEDVKKFITTTNLPPGEMWKTLYGQNLPQLQQETQKSQAKPKKSDKNAKNKRQVTSWQLYD